MRCPDCDAEVIIPCDIQVGEIVSCPCCGTEFEYTKDGTLEEITLNGEDWGE